MESRIPDWEELEALRIEVKIAKHGRKSLTRGEEVHISYSPWGNGGGCTSSLGAFPAAVPDPEAYATAKLIEGMLAAGKDPAVINEGNFFG